MLNCVDDIGNLTVPSGDAVIELVVLEKDTCREAGFALRQNVLILKKGVLLISMFAGEIITLKANEMIFMPIGAMCSLVAAEDLELVIVSVSCVDEWDAHLLRDTVENEVKLSDFNDMFDTQGDASPGILIVKPDVWCFLEEVIDYLDVNVDISDLLKLKVEEFLLLLNYFYSKDQLRLFFNFYSDRTNPFVEFVLLNWRSFSTVSMFAQSMNMSVSQFNMNFTELFKQSPYKWMISHRSKLIWNELTRTDKPLKQIAIENNFKTLSHFNTFCKLHLGKTPLDIRKDSLED